MSKRGIIGRVAQLAHANVNAVIDAAENPRQTAEQLARDYATTIAEAEEAIAGLSDNRRVTEDDQREDADAAEMWAAAAAATSQTADELRSAGDAEAADRFDDLARVALVKELMAENDVEASQRMIAAQSESVETLTTGLGRLHARLSELTDRRSSMRAGSAGAHTRPWPRDPVISHVDVLDPATDVALFEDVVRREGSRRDGIAAEAQPSDALPGDFADGSGDKSRENEIEERLQGLKMARAMASALARAHDQNGAL